MNFENPYILWGTSIIIAFLPTFTWVYFLFKKSDTSKKHIIAMFFFGILTVIPLLAIQYSWNFFPQLNVASVIPQKVENIYFAKFLTFIVFAMMEEVFKQWLLRFADKKWLLVKTVNDSIKLSIVAALGFSFAENVYPYFFSLISMGDFKGLIGAYFFRSLFTAAAHIFFSGIFGYYYGMSKFVADFRDQEKWQGKKLYITKIISSIFQIPQDQAFREQKILYGLTIALGLHGIYNTFLQFNWIIPSLAIVLTGFTYLMILLKRGSGQLNLVLDISTAQQSQFSNRDQKVILEIIGNWFNQGKYKDVIATCDRALQRDPDNNLIKLFKAKSEEKLQGVDLYHEATEVIGTRKQVEDHSTLQNLQKQNITTNFKDTDAYQKFLEDEKKKKEESTTFKLDTPEGGPMI